MFSLVLSRYIDQLTLQIESLRPGPRREAIRRERIRLMRPILTKQRRAK